MSGAPGATGPFGESPAGGGTAAGGTAVGDRAAGGSVAGNPAAEGPPAGGPDAVGAAASGTAAVDAGAHATRVAGPELLGVLPAGTGPAAAVTAFTAAGVRRWASVPVGAAVRHRLGLPQGWLVIDAGAAAVRIHAPDGSVRVVDAGGDRLDEDLAALLPGLPARREDVRLLRETLSLQPAASLTAGGRRVRIEAAAVREALAARFAAVGQAARAVVRGAGQPVAGVVLAGGVARAPQLVESVQAALDGLPVVVAPSPELAAVLGAAMIASAEGAGQGGPDTGAARPAADAHAMLVAELEPGPEPPPGPAGAGHLPPLPRPRRARLVAACLLGAAGAMGAAGVAGLVTGNLGGPARGAAELVQYGYRFELPAGWEQTGGLPERRRTLLTQSGAPDGTGLLAVERTGLGYDANAEPGRALAELTARFAAEAAAEGMSDLVVGERVAGRPVVRFRQTVPGPPGPGPQGGPGTGAESDADSPGDGPGAGTAGGPAVVDWFVLFEGTDQFSVGCRHPAAGSAEVDRACAAVVGSVRRA